MFNANAGESGGNRTRSRRRIVVIIICVVVAFGALLGADLLVLNSRVQRFPFVQTSSPAGETWLIIGVDDRSALPDGPDVYGRPDDHGARADIVLAVTRRGDRWQLLSIPRDLMVITSTGADRFATMYLEGPQEAVNALCKGYRIPANHLVVVTLRAFVEVVDAMGGVEVTMDAPLRDGPAHLKLAAGKQTLDGHTALALVRSRHPEVQVNGKWVAEKQGALARQRHSGLVLAAITERLRKADLITLQRIAWAATGQLQIDANTSLADLWGLRTLSGPMLELPGDYVPENWTFGPTDQTYERLAELGYTPRCNTG